MSKSFYCFKFEHLKDTNFCSLLQELIHYSRVIIGLIPKSDDEDTFIYLDYIYLRHKKIYEQKMLLLQFICDCQERSYSEALWRDYVFGKQTVFQLNLPLLIG